MLLILCNPQNTVARNVDTDVLVLAVHHFKPIANIGQDVVLGLGMRPHKRHVSVQPLAENLPTHMPSNILAVHALTGCDSVSGIFNIFRKWALNTMKETAIDI